MIDLKRCRRALLYEGPESGWPLICAQDSFEPCTDYTQMDFIWIHKPTPHTAAKQLWMLPFQGERFYHVSAVDFLVKTRRISVKDLGVGIRASARLSRETFREPLDAIEAKLPEHLRKLGVNSWLGSLMCDGVRWRVFSAVGT